MSDNERVEQDYEQVKDEPGWADFQVRSDAAIRRHRVLPEQGQENLFDQFSR
jgi:hypothetical protein